MREGQSDLDAACGDARNPHIANVADDAPGSRSPPALLTLRMRRGCVLQRRPARADAYNRQRSPVQCPAIPPCPTPGRNVLFSLVERVSLPSSRPGSQFFDRSQAVAIAVPSFCTPLRVSEELPVCPGRVDGRIAGCGRRARTRPMSGAAAGGGRAADQAVDPAGTRSSVSPAARLRRAGRAGSPSRTRRSALVTRTAPPSLTLHPPPVRPDGARPELPGSGRSRAPPPPPPLPPSPLPPAPGALGLPTWSDKLVGEVVRLLLEAYYEPTFSGHSHGFRPGRGCPRLPSEKLDGRCGLSRATSPTALGL